jgi:hypothetical protein
VTGSTAEGGIGEASCTDVSFLEPRRFSGTGFEGRYGGGGCEVREGEEGGECEGEELHGC